MVPTLLGLSLLFSFLVTERMRHYGPKWHLMDIPNPRSSHSLPTPRAGGIGIVFTVLIAVPFLAFQNLLGWNFVAALVGGGGLVALIGFVDDRVHLCARTRIVAHFVAAGWALYWLRGIPAIQVGSISWAWGWPGNLAVLVGMVWLVNLYNFMDGIDGIAGVEAVCAAGVGALLLASHHFSGLAVVAAVMATSSAGFLLWNWPPARIFMGDGSSGFLGFAFGLLIVASTRKEGSLLWAWLILLLVFIVDSAVTLLRRFLGGARWYEAHCSHTYQHASRRWGSLKVIRVVAGLNVAWLLPLAWAAMVWSRLGLMFTLIAAFPLVLLAFHFRAGCAEASRTEASAAALRPGGALRWRSR